MQKVWFTADTHYGHNNIVHLSNRPYASIEEHDAQLIANYNALVGKNDTCYHLGDFAYRCSYDHVNAIFSQLNGQKHLLIGNHDEDQGAVLNLPWVSVQHMKTIKIHGKDNKHELIVLSHYPMRAWPGSYYKRIHLFGHVHGHFPGTDCSCDVGVDCWNYKPVSLDDLKKRMESHNEDIYKI